MARTKQTAREYAKHEANRVDKHGNLVEAGKNVAANLVKKKPTAAKNDSSTNDESKSPPTTATRKTQNSTKKASSKRRRKDKPSPSGPKSSNVLNTVVIIGSTPCPHTKYLVAKLVDESIPFVYLSHKRFRSDEIGEALRFEAGVERKLFPFSLLVEAEFPTSHKFDAADLGDSKDVIANLVTYNIEPPQWKMVNTRDNKKDILKAVKNGKHFRFMG